jgi:hypothetical protein
MRLEVDHVPLGDRAEHAVRIRAGFLLYHSYVVTFHERLRQAQIPVKPGGTFCWKELSS